MAEGDPDDLVLCKVEEQQMKGGPYPGSDSGSSSPGTRTMQCRHHDDKLLLLTNITINLQN